MFWSIYSRPKFSTQVPQLFIIKICFIIKVNSICGTGRDTRNLSQVNSQGPALMILGFSVASPKSQGPSSGVLSVRVAFLESQVSGSRVSGSQTPRVLDPWSKSPVYQGPGVSSLRVPDLRVPGSLVSGPDFRLCLWFWCFSIDVILS